MMKSVSNLATTIGILVILFACAVSVVPQARVTARKEVKVYFYHDPGEYIDLAPVTRSVSSAGPARLAPVRFKTAVELTLKQFPSVRRVIISLNGNAKFYDERG